MNEQPHASRRRLLVSTLVAAVAAAFVLVAFVLPAEYAIDPLGIGRLVGLDALGTAKTNPPITEVMHAHPRKFYSGKLDIELSARQELEYKATLAQGEPMLYSWRVQGGPVYFEFHGEPTEGEWPAGFVHRAVHRPARLVLAQPERCACCHHAAGERLLLPARQDRSEQGASGIDQEITQ
jgi:hypothetical protein